MLKTTVNHNIIVSTWEEYISGFREYYARKKWGNPCVQYAGH